MLHLLFGTRYCFMLVTLCDSDRLYEHDTSGQRLVEKIEQRHRYRLLLVTTNLAVEM